MADAMLRHRVGQAGLQDQIEVDSAGTGAWHVGEPAHPQTMALLKANHIPYDGRARQLEPADLKRFDYILAMDRQNLAGILRLANRGEQSAQAKLVGFQNAQAQPEIVLFLSYANQVGTVTALEVPDPYENGRYALVYELVDKGCDAFLAYLRRKHEL
jgi:protein-tyrosine phosphatase